jgi:tRNA1(Val) A37 N6-methylase TrmN6
VLDKYNFGIKRLQTVHSFENSESHFMMIEAVRNRKVQTIIEKPLIIFDSNRNYKGELGEIFGI